MKKKFIITEEQAQKILRLDELTQNQPSSLDPCVHFTASLAPSVAGLWSPGTIAQGGPVSNFGDIDCCEMLSGNMTGPFGGTAGNAMLQSHCDVGWSQAVLGYGTFAQGNQLQTSLGWAGCCDHDTTTSSKCERCDNPGEFRMNGVCMKCVEDVNNPGCCKDQSTVGNGDRPCPDVECENPNHVPNPSNKCKCECQNPESCKKPLVWDEDQCACVKKVVGPPLQTENRLRKRKITRGKLPRAPRRR